MSESGPLVVDIDLDDRGFVLQPFDTWRDLRAAGPIAWSPRHGGFWIVTGYDEAASVLQDSETFGSADGIWHPRNTEMPPVALIETDPPDHRKYRLALNPLLSVQRAQDMEAEIRQLVDELIDSFIESGQSDLVDRLARPLAQTTLFRLLGVPQTDAPRVAELVHTWTRKFMEDPVAGKRAAVEFMGYLRNLVTERREGAGGRDLISVLIEGDATGQVLRDEEIASLLVVVFSGGLNTVKSQIGGALLYLADHGEQRRELIENRSLLPAAIEEFLRLVTPIHGLFRTVRVDTALGGVNLARGDKVFVSYSSANRDERMFARADECVLDRHPNRHLAFGLGIHRCIGSHLARVQIRVALESVLERLPDYRTAPGTTVRWDVGPGTWGVDSLPAVFTPGARRYQQAVGMAGS